MFKSPDYSAMTAIYEKTWVFFFKTICSAYVPMDRTGKDAGVKRMKRSEILDLTTFTVKIKGDSRKCVAARATA